MKERKRKGRWRRERQTERGREDGDEERTGGGEVREREEDK